MSSDFLNSVLPDLSATTIAAIRIGYGVTLFFTLILLLPHWRRFFLSERWGGYGVSCRFVDAAHNPYVFPVVATMWLTAAATLTTGIYPLASSLVNLVICRYYFVSMRWKGALRGLGAPGFMTYWLGWAVFLLELITAVAPTVLPFTVLLLQVDFALIMLSAGLYKIASGYPRNMGMQFGMANPEWGYWWRAYQKLPPNHWLYRFCNHCAWSIQTIASLLLLVPPTRSIGALLIIGSFLFVATQIRLSLLCYMVIVGAFVFFPSGSYCDATLAGIVPEALIGQPGTSFNSPVATLALATFTIGHLALVVLSYAGLFYNFYSRRSLPSVLQSALEAYTNFFGIIIWRVFSADHTSFYVMVYRRRRSDSSRTLVSNYDKFGSRFNHVGECIAIKCVFTTLKYYPSDSARFHERLLRYARTIPCPDDSVLAFEYITLDSDADRFQPHVVAEFIVDPRSETISELPLHNPEVVRKPTRHSPVFEGTRPGSYAPLRS